MKRPSARHQLITWALIAVAVLVVVLLILVGVGVLRIATGTSGPGTLTVSRVHWTILQGTINGSSTVGWFGPFTFNYTYADGYPLQTAAGETFVVGVVLSDLGGVPHYMYSALASAPFTLKACHPTLPVQVPVDDDAGFAFTIQTPNTPGAVLPLNITLDALHSGASCPAP